MGLRVRKLLAFWLMTALVVLVSPTRSSRAAEHDGVERTGYGEVSAHASRRAGVSPATESPNVDDDVDDVMASADPRIGVRADEGHVDTSTAVDVRARWLRTNGRAGPRGPPRA